nr:hypothetical protein [Campylobacter iguaniorum]
MNFIRLILVGLVFVATMSAKDINVVIFLADKVKFDSAFTITSGLQKTLQKDEKADIELVLGGSAVEIFASKSKKRSSYARKNKNISRYAKHKSRSLSRRYEKRRHRRSLAC